MRLCPMINRCFINSSPFVISVLPIASVTSLCCRSFFLLAISVCGEVGRDFIIPFRFVFSFINSSAAGSSARCTFRLFSNQSPSRKKRSSVSFPSQRSTSVATQRWRHRLNFSNGVRGARVWLTVTDRSDPARCDAMRSADMQISAGHMALENWEGGSRTFSNRGSKVNVSQVAAAAGPRHKTPKRAREQR